MAHSVQLKIEVLTTVAHQRKLKILVASPPSLFPGSINSTKARAGKAFFQVRKKMARGFC